MKLLTLFFILMVSTGEAQEPAKAGENAPAGTLQGAPLVKNSGADCFEALKIFPGQVNKELLRRACDKVQVMEGCYSVKGEAIFHYDRAGNHRSQQKILVFSLIHGDETGAGTLGRLWMQRLEEIEPRNSWRVVPILNPDGVKLKTRTNANKVDLNRNFPTKDWHEKAQDYWVKHTKSNPRRFPGSQPASEPELNCAIKHVEDFKPDLVVSIHTPLKVLDFDGPKVTAPKNFDYLPWKSLGNYPGSLGRYLWHERQTPVLTTELREDLPKTDKPLIELQDVIGHLVSLEFPAQEKTGKRPEKKPEVPVSK